MNHVNINTNPCSSCGMCVVSCSQKAITFDYDENGFYRPNVNESKCTDCGTCIKVCYKYLEPQIPFENIFREKPVYGAWSKNIETVKTSSSGGVGYELTAHFFEKAYKICGCIFDAPNDSCKHIIAETTEDLGAIKTSKYLQSNIVESFSRFEKNEKYLVVGTPCQIYGLRKWIQLKRWENNFILIDFFCHGTPSFNLWRKYKEYICQTFLLDSEWKSVNFRKKNHESKWHKNAISIHDSQGKSYEKNQAFSKDLFFKFFLNNSCLNETCYKCKVRLDYCASDIRIADFWGPKYTTNNDGVSLVIVNTPKGEKVWEDIKDKLAFEKCAFDDLVFSQPTRFLSSHCKQLITLNELRSSKSLYRIYIKYFRRSILQKGLSYLRRRLLK